MELVPTGSKRRQFGNGGKTKVIGGLNKRFPSFFIQIFNVVYIVVLIVVF